MVRDGRAAWRTALYAAVLLATAAFLAPTGDDETVSSAFPNADKVVHVAAFAALAFLARAAHPAAKRGLLFAALAAYGGGVELLQEAVPGREPDIRDLAADALGAGLVLLGRRARHRAPSA